MAAGGVRLLCSFVLSAQGRIELNLDFAHPISVFGLERQAAAPHQPQQLLVGRVDESVKNLDALFPGRLAQNIQQRPAQAAPLEAVFNQHRRFGTPSIISLDDIVGVADDGFCRRFDAGDDADAHSRVSSAA